VCVCVCVTAESSVTVMPSIEVLINVLCSVVVSYLYIKGRPVQFAGSMLHFTQPYGLSDT